MPVNKHELMVRKAGYDDGFENGLTFGLCAGITISWVVAFLLFVV